MRTGMRRLGCVAIALCSVLGTSCGTKSESSFALVQAADIGGTWRGACVSQSYPSDASGFISFQATLVYTATSTYTVTIPYFSGKDCAIASSLHTTVETGTFLLSGTGPDSSTNFDMTMKTLTLAPASVELAAAYNATTPPTCDISTWSAGVATDITTNATCAPIWSQPHFQIVALVGGKLILGDYTAEADYDGTTAAKRIRKLGAATPFTKQ